MTSAGLGKPKITSAGLGKPKITSAGLGKPKITSAGLGKPKITSAGLGKPKMTSAGLGKPKITSAGLGKPRITSAGLGKPKMSQTSTSAGLGKPKMTSAGLGAGHSSSGGAKAAQEALGFQHLNSLAESILEKKLKPEPGDSRITSVLENFGRAFRAGLLMARLPEPVQLGFGYDSAAGTIHTDYEQNSSVTIPDLRQKPCIPQISPHSILKTRFFQTLGQAIKKLKTDQSSDGIIRD
ncbi:hypothetical protein DUI87_25313 [Hirundo rustica rustica]|uniref:Uncharacterized protein n=1 Tax=Hirundo rustica rustica TaxID=333673 RepID=A0A3M0JB53_HIRRU|nr:hypothetical protein DUI87_25313 [Hirundo rustica rustica]